MRNEKDKFYIKGKGWMGRYLDFMLCFDIMQKMLINDSFIDYNKLSIRKIFNMEPVILNFKYVPQMIENQTSASI